MRYLQGAIPRRAMDELQWWDDWLQGPVPPERWVKWLADDTTRQRCASVCVHTDASGLALGAFWPDGHHETAWWLSLLVPVTWRFDYRAETRPGGLAAELAASGGDAAGVGAGRPQSSANLESRAILAAVLAWAHLWRGRVVCIRNDNAAAVSAFSRRHSSHPQIADAIKIAHDYAMEHSTELVFEWIPGDRNITADALSRRHDFDTVIRTLIPQACPHQALPMRGDPWMSWSEWRGASTGQRRRQARSAHIPQH